MKTQAQWFGEYAESHQHKTNQSIHYICVPLIYWSIVGMLMSIPTTQITSITKLQMPLLENWAAVTLIFIHVFYIRLSLATFFKMLVFSVLCVLDTYFISTILPLFYTSLTVFILAWAGQFYGHKLEGKKPSFLKDLQFLLIGPIWVIEKLTNPKVSRS